jgi:glutamine amidotransferase
VNVAIINYGMGNLGSVRRAFEECGAVVRIADEPAALAGAERLVLPGVGAFSDGMKNLVAGQWPAAIARTLQNPRAAILGLCLGMHLIADKGYEGGESRGLGLFPGEVKRMTAADGERLPHVGWNEVRIVRPDPLLAGIDEGTDFYFVHSYALTPAHLDDTLARTPYCGGFASVVRRGNVFGTQFHPEKSSRAGFQLLRNFLSESIFDA